MANSYITRKAKKRLIGGYVDRELKAALVIVAKSEGKTQKELIEEFVLEGLKNRINAPKN